MQKILERLFFGNVCPNERTRLSSEEYTVARDAAIQAHDAFEDKLTEALKTELDEWFSKETAINALYNVQYFTDGFRLGAQLMLAILEVGKDD